MANVWYIGDAHVRQVFDQIFSKANGWSIPESEFTGPQLIELDADQGFLLGQTGPRANPPWVPDATPDPGWPYFNAVKQIQNSILGIAGSDRGLAFMQNVRYENAVRVGMAGDSTGNNADEWFDMAMTALATDHPDQKWSAIRINPATGEELLAPTVIQPGNAPTPGVKARDTLNTVSADLSGRTPTLGGSVWSNDGSNGVGDWTVAADGATATAETVRGTQLLDMGVSGEMETRVDMTLSTVIAAGPRSIRVMGNYKSNSDQIFGTIVITQAGGAGQLNIFKRIGDVATKISAATDITSTAITANTAGQAITAKIKLVGTTVTFTVNKGATTDTVTATVSADEAAILRDGSKGGIGVNQAIPLSIKLTLFELTLISVATPTEAKFYNTAVSGTRLEHQQARLVQLFPERLDVLFLSGGHNYQQRTPAEFHALIDSFVADFLKLWPGTPIIITGQNPEYAPATARLAHNLRQASLPGYCKSRGFGYIPVTHQFLNKTNKGRDLVIFDGIHPTTGAVDTGSSLWRDLVLAYLNSL